jgi:hypothetical protein
VIEVELETEVVLADQFAARGRVSNLIKAAGKHQRLTAAQKATAKAFDDADDAAMTLLDVKPTTVAGAAALLRYAFEVSKRNDWVWPDLGDDEGEPVACTALSSCR